MSNLNESSNATAATAAAPVAASPIESDVIVTNASGGGGSSVISGAGDSTASAAAAIANAFNLNHSAEASLAHTSLGYCHVCNKQNRINTETFTCVQCNCGFIELFDLNDNPSSTSSSNPRR